MKAKVASLLVVLFLTTTQCMAQKRITVEAQSNDISYNLDLKAVASIFGDSRDLEDFERRLNDYDSQISNLDLNNDGEVDYLRVIETSENNVHVVVVQAVLDRDVFQDVATIVVEKNRYNRTYVQVIGDPYMYGDNYIIEPVYYHTPSIFSFFWSRRYHTWRSPYYWGYYPSYYRYRNPFEVNIYLSHIHSHVNHRHNYRYSDYRRNEYSERLQRSISRNDYSQRYPERNFSRRNENIRNKKEIEVRRSDVNRPSGSRTEAGRRNDQGIERSSGGRIERNSTGTRNTSPTWNGGGATQKRSATPSGTRNSEIKRESNQSRTNQSTQSGTRTNENVQSSRGRSEQNTKTYSPPSNSRNYEQNKRTNEPSPSNSRTYERPSTNRNERPAPSIQRESAPNRVAPSNTPSRVEPRQVERRVESKQVERKAPESKPAENKSSRDNNSERGSRSSDNNRR